MTDTTVRADEQLVRAQSDRLRPAFHFTSPAGWLNDPNGVAQIDGLHHLFYQHNPEAPVHNRIHWGHAVSDDLVHWRDRPIALRPGEGADGDGCWSGVLVDDAGTPTLIYSGRQGLRELPCLAVGSADLEEWSPLPEPVISTPPEGDLTAYRDHCVWREGDVWRQLIGSGVRGDGGCAFLYESTDLREWRLIGPLASLPAGQIALDDPDWTGTMWECVDFFRLLPGDSAGTAATAAPDAASGDPHALIFSAWHEGATLHPLIALGRYRDDRFQIDRVQRLDLGRRHAYAPQTYRDEAGRRILWSWMQEGRTDEAMIASGWSGAMALPRTLWLDRAGVVRQEPVPEFAALRTHELAGDWSGDTLDIEVDALVGDGRRLAVTVLATPDGEEACVVELARRDGALHLSLDRSRSSADTTADRSRLAGTVPEPGTADDCERPSRLRIVVDRSSIEVFCDGIALTARVYPTRTDALGARVEGNAAVTRATAWHMAGAEEHNRIQLH
ncbi:glycosyl hydrolase family 32 [Pseudoclavibacter sp. RFBJ3]|uniref:glycoside hydrolase family 32 protein n=1 Tax=unclassified Pseudoclavibacter TaxID=2615177 RepID=UPI000CE8B8EF|nr:MULTISPECIES: glycoside hydrolase family 32 protein [unclassified Pseudoclavibacter]PPF81975.1 glycosyl hydrolase family 32 [Pseudoclavibacter sp. RFBJ5]PPF95473.1 glycosyl hydrolase family 32 [Pseudoclavibacter sp. RFBJ3]PPF95949.1 glycosyl hydrolase family 32 [Pseudoclavibacter sp. RFBH5]PPG21241.1 glycosyl hydrolase family 32 [Pseudoclavibacter sp. RFBI4]